MQRPRIQYNFILKQVFQKLKQVKKLVVLVGLEPTTPPMSWECATNCAKGRCGIDVCKN